VKAILIVHSYHHRNTGKVAARMAEVLGARVVSPRQADPEELLGCDLVGFGSGIYGARHHRELLELAGRLRPAGGRRAFIFSTDGTPRFLLKGAGMPEAKMREDHAALREALRAKGYDIAGEFNCAGLNTNSFLKWFAGFNRGRPDARDLARAAGFARALAEKSP